MLPITIQGEQLHKGNRLFDFDFEENKITFKLSRTDHRTLKYKVPHKKIRNNLSRLQELIDNTNSEWIKNFNGSGVNGRKFTSKTNGNSIFIPASGFRLDSLFRHQGSISSVWSSSLDPAYYGSAWCLYFDWYDINDGYGDRSRGRCVRGVMG